MGTTIAHARVSSIGVIVKPKGVAKFVAKGTLINGGIPSPVNFMVVKHDFNVCYPLAIPDIYPSKSIVRRIGGIELAHCHSMGMSAVVRLNNGELYIG